MTTNSVSFGDMEEITRTRGKYILTHKRFIDPYTGFEVDSFNLFDSEKRVNIPFNAPIKVADYDKDATLGKLNYSYSNNDYEKMLTDEIKIYEEENTHIKT